ncbi:sulfotransferase [Algicella marina]|uniref:Sulfotransferase n=1 Tax=Algicella marina TaxID=2683284 RepID=A0A6P1SYK0_9RHOB|nr:sulfotransferase [Algicella marina]QHQ34605.1 hypothetical protein GO499_05065 [Algicella marina]
MRDDADLDAMDDAEGREPLVQPDHPDRHLWRRLIGTPGPHPAAEDATYVFGLGAQKSGSTWLFDYLAGHPDCYVPVRKELHYFSNPYHVDLGKLESRYLNRLARRGKAFLEAKPKAKAARGQQMLDDVLWRAMFPVGHDGHASYLRYLSSGYEGQRCICDITPAYAVVERDMMAEMHRIVPRSRFVFFMRDPVGRLWSQARMNGFRRKGVSEDKKAKASARFFRQALEAFDINKESRDNYIRTLGSLEAVVPKENRFVCFFESFFAQKDESALAAFLGITPQPAAFEKQVNSGRGSAPIPEELAVEGARVLAPVYEGIFERFGDAVPDKWRKTYEAGK